MGSAGLGSGRTALPKALRDRAGGVGDGNPWRKRAQPQAGYRDRSRPGDPLYSLRVSALSGRSGRIHPEVVAGVRALGVPVRRGRDDVRDGNHSGLRSQRSSPAGDLRSGVRGGPAGHFSLFPCAAAPVTNELRVLRARRNWSQADLAARLGVSRQTVNAIETGRYDPSLRLPLNLLVVFGEPIEKIFGWRTVRAGRRPLSKLSMHRDRPQEHNRRSGGTAGTGRGGKQRRNTQTARTAYQLAAARASARLRRLRGKVRFSQTVAELKAGRWSRLSRRSAGRPGCGSRPAGRTPWPVVRL